MKTFHHEHFNHLNSFDMFVSYVETDSLSPTNTFDSHAHEECEIYINLSGDVAFMVENRIYPIKQGDVIITRPFEYHHCIYNSNKLHKHFWILLSPSGNEDILNIFFDRKLGTGNHLILSPENTQALITLCHQMTNKTNTKTISYYNFFKLINLLQNADSVDDFDSTYPESVNFAINYISRFYTDHISISEIARQAHVSVNTLERHFMQYLNATPTAFIKNRRLANSIKLLSDGETVENAAIKSGFSDCSSFITTFKKVYGITPLKYKKENRN